MKVSSLFNLITDASDVLDYFERVDSPAQLVTRLDHLRRLDSARARLTCIAGLRSSVAEALEDTLEMSAMSPTILDDTEGDELIDAELDSLTEATSPNPEPEKHNPVPLIPPEDGKNNPT